MDFKIEPLQNPNLDEMPDKTPGDIKKEPQQEKRSFYDFVKNLTRAKYVVLALSAILLLALISFFLNRGSFKESGVELKIEAPAEITGGDLVTYKITYKNNNAVSLSNVKLNILYPTDSIVTKEGNITELTAENFDIGLVGSNDKGQKEIEVYLVGDKGSVKTIKASLTYKAGQLSSVFRKDTTLATTINNLAVPINLVATPTIISGQNTSYFIDYRNETSQDLDNLRLLVKYPSGFIPSKYSLGPSSHTVNQDSWDLDKIKQGEGSRITIQGAISGNERESKVIAVTLQKKITTPKGDIYVNFEKSEASSVISSPLLSVSLKLNNSDNYVAHLGDDLRYVVTFRNSSGSDLTGLNLSVKLDGSMYDFSTVKSDGYFDGRQNTISWNASTTPLLNLLSTNQSGTVEVNVRLKSNFSGGLGASDSLVKASGHLETLNVPANLDLDKLATDNQVITRISTAPTFDQKIYINDAAFGSTGPYPPKVNQKTAFTIHWNLVNPASDIAETKVTATLAPGVEWENKTSSNGSSIQPTYNTAQNTVTWNLGTLPAGTGISTPLYDGYFQISITPSVNQVGQSVPLLKNIHFDGVDSFTKEKISRTIFDANSSNISDNNTVGGSVTP